MFDLENSVERYLKEQCKKRLHTNSGLKALCLKCDIIGFTGMPDRMILLPVVGTVVFAELKNKGKKERSRQLYVQDLLRKMGFWVFSTVDTKEKVDAVVDKCEELMYKYE